MLLLLARVMAPDQVLLPPGRFSSAPPLLMPVPLRMIVFAIVRPLPSTCTAALLPVTIAAFAAAPRAAAPCTWMTPWLMKVRPVIMQVYCFAVLKKLRFVAGWLFANQDPLRRILISNVKYMY